jgi:hypothetical protein
VSIALACISRQSGAVAWERDDMFRISLAMMLNLWLAGSPLASSPTNAWAYGKMNTMVELAHALADESRCPDLAVNFGSLEETTRFYHIDIMNSGFDFSYMWETIGRQNERIATMSRDAVCAEGLEFYGPGGKRRKGLLTEK